MDIQREIRVAADALLRGGVAAFPTDTVYGLGVAACAAETPQALFDIKRRDAGKPVAWLVGSVNDLRTFGENVPEYATALARAFWPGPLTLIVKASSAAPISFQSDGGTIGLRMPASEIALTLIRAVGYPLATTSANLSGEAAPWHFEDLDPAIVAAANAVVRDDMRGQLAQDADGATPGEDGAPPRVNVPLRASGVAASAVFAASGVASTVLDCTAEHPKMLREGSLSVADMREAIPGLRFDD